MIDHQTAAASSASAAAAVLWAAGQPPDAVVIAALSGGVLSVWGDPPSRISIGWAFGAFGRLLLSVAVGLAGAASLPAVASGYSVLAPIAAAPQWVISGVCSLLAPFIVGAARSWLVRLSPQQLPKESGQ